MTDLVTGRPARWIRNRFVDALLEADPGTLGWGGRRALVGDLRRAAAEQGRADILPMLAGEGSSLSGEREPAAEIVARLVRETEAALADLAALLRCQARPRWLCTSCVVISGGASIPAFCVLGMMFSPAKRLN